MRSRQCGNSSLLIVALLYATFGFLSSFSVHSFTHQLPLPATHLIRQGQLANSPVWIELRLSANDDDQYTGEDYFIREALPADMGIASRILADGFFSDKNFLGYQLEKLKTYLSLESDFPRTRDEHVMLVACQRTDGKVVACCDIDNRPSLKVRPYMCNLAVDATWRGRGLAKALIAECEAIALKWGTNELHLKARQRNDSAIALYKSVGYFVQKEGYDASYRDYLVAMKKDISSPLDDRNGAGLATTNQEQQRMVCERNRAPTSTGGTEGERWLS